MSERERGRFSAAEIREIGPLLKVEYPWQLRHLGSVLSSLPEMAASVRITHFETPPSSALFLFSSNPIRPGHWNRVAWL